MPGELTYYSKKIEVICKMSKTTNGWVKNDISQDTCKNIGIPTKVDSVEKLLEYEQLPVSRYISDVVRRVLDSEYADLSDGYKEFYPVDHDDEIVHRGIIKTITIMVDDMPPDFIISKLHKYGIDFWDMYDNDGYVEYCISIDIYNILGYVRDYEKDQKHFLSKIRKNYLAWMHKSTKNPRYHIGKYYPGYRTMLEGPDHGYALYHNSDNKLVISPNGVHMESPTKNGAMKILHRLMSKPKEYHGKLRHGFDEFPNKRR